jgi:hypothetical protein
VKPLVIEEEAELELVGSIAFYEEKKAGLGLDFETAARQALETIVAAQAAGLLVTPKAFASRELPCSVFATDYTDFHRSITLG